MTQSHGSHEDSRVTEEFRIYLRSVFGMKKDLLLFGKEKTWEFNIFQGQGREVFQEGA